MSQDTMRAMFDWSDFRMELEAAGRDDLSRWVGEQAALSTPAEPRTVEPLTEADALRLINEIQAIGSARGWDVREKLIELAIRAHSIGAKWGLVLAGGEQG